MRASLTEGSGEEVLLAIRAAGVDLTAVTGQLLRDGVKSFGDSYDALVRAVAERSSELAALR